MDTLMQDLRYAFRAIRRAPGFTTIVVTVLALGIGGTTVIFAVTDAVLFRPLAFPRAERLARAFGVWRGNPGEASPPDFTDWRKQNRAFEELAATNSGSFALTGEGAAEQLSGSQVTGGYFAVMSVQPLLGRTFTPADDEVGGPNVAVLGFGLWQRRFGGDSGVVGRMVRLDAEAYRVIGIMPAGFDHPQGSDLWLPLRFTAQELATQRGAHYIDVIGRLKPGVTLADANADLQHIARDLSAAYPQSNANTGARVTSLREAMVGSVQSPLLILLAAVGVVLLIACINVAGLLLVRGLGRERELAIRASLGAGRVRVVRALLAESVMLSAFGACAGVGLAVWGTNFIAGLTSAGIPLLNGARLDARVFAFTAVATALTAVSCGLFPAWQTSSLGGLATRLKAEGRGTTGNRLRTRNGLVVVETALAVLLLAGAGLLLRSFDRLRNVDPGYDASHVLTFGVSLPSGAYAKPAQSAQFYQDLTRQLEALPGVSAAGAVFGLPLSNFGYNISAYELDGRILPREESENLSAQIRAATPGYFKTMGISIRRGRGIEPGDRVGAPPVIVINEAAARKFWPGKDALGRRLIVGTRLGLGGERAGGEVVGVIADIKESALAAPAAPTMFLAHAQFPMGFTGVVVRTAGNPLDILPSAQATLRAVDPNVPMFRVRSMEQIVDASVAQPKLYAMLLSVFSFVAITLAAVGLYGVLAHSVAQRGREMGVRLALGATARDLVKMVAGQAVLLAGVGVLLGLGVALVVTRVLRSLLFGIESTDPATFIVVAALLFLVAALASYVPARRAARVDPIVALRSE